MRQGTGTEAATAAPISLTAPRAALEVYLELGKARLSGLVVATALVGFLLASRGPIDWAGLAWTVLGTGLIVAGANAFNQVIERERDTRMTRTRTRPLPAGRLTPRHAVTVAAATSFSGLLVLALFTNVLTAALALVAFSIYVFLYTPLKTRSTVCTLVGAVSGAIPPMMGWTAAAGRIEPGAWLLFGLLFAWQIPHFLALAWLCRDDYERGGFVMLPLVDREGHATCRLVLLYSLAILPIGLAFPLAGLAGWVYTLGSVILGGALLALCTRLYRFRTAAAARRVFLASVIYLPLLLGLMIADRSSLPATPLQSSSVETAQAESVLPSGPFVRIETESAWVSRGDF